MSLEIPKRIEKSDIEPLPIKVGETEIVLQRHGVYERSADSPIIGSLTEKGAEDVYNISRNFFRSLFEGIPQEERSNLDILVIASDTQYRGGGRRSVETANKVMEAIREELKQFGMNDSQLLNTSGKYRSDEGPRTMPDLREPQMLDNSPEFVAFLKDKYGDLSKEFWLAFEGDIERETRQAMKAEGPDGITDRIKHVIEVLRRYSRMYHAKHPEKRLIIWAATHYDTISPYVKREIIKAGKDAALGVDYGAGISIHVDAGGNLATRISGNDYKF